MRSNELRIGNWVWNDVQKMPYQVDGNLIGLYHCREKAGVEICLSPVLLTEEWLMKLNFTKAPDMNEVTYDYDNWNKIFYRVFRFNLGCFYWSEDSRDIWVKLEYVHQLQNLYFALTGEELTIKE